jgi:acetyltransferase-like isoleucine patch superfamily enzyme
MLKKSLQKILNKIGKNYTINQDIPDSLILSLFFTRGLMLLRGILLIRKKIFLGKNVCVKNKRNFDFGKNVTIEKYTDLDGYASSRIYLGNNAKIGSYSKLLCTSHLATYGKGFKMGDNSAMGDYCHIGSAGGIEIGNDVIMGSYISFHSENHNYDNPDVLIREQGVNSKGIKIGDNIWIGAKVTFLDGCIIGNNSIVAAGAVVKGVFPPNVIIGGVPAKVLKTIYNEN